MIRILVFLVLSRHIYFTFAIPPQTHSDLNDLFPSINNSVSALGAHQRLQCDSRYGENLDILDCRNAITQMKTGSEQVVVAHREDILPGDEATIPLPYRLMGSESSSALRSYFSLESLSNDSRPNSDSAHCFIQPVLMPEASSGRVSLDQLKAAASVVLGQCAFGPNFGGILKNIGIRPAASSIMGHTLTRAILWVMETLP